MFANGILGRIEPFLGALAAGVGSIGRGIFPDSCAICARPVHDRWRLPGLCESCRYRVSAAPDSSELIDRFFRFHSGETLHLSAVHALFNLTEDPGLLGLIHRMKYSGHSVLAQLYGRELGLWLKHIGVGIDVLVPVPTHPARFRYRGYNQAALIAKGIAEHHPCKTSTAVVRQRNTRTQTLLDPSQRRQNLDNAFCINDKELQDITGQRFAIVDDVFTTGSTMNQCAQVLRRYGATNVIACVLAAA